MEAQKRDEINLSGEEMSRYARHLSLPEIGIIGQKHLKASSVLCVGSGGLGSPLLLYLAAAGIGHIGIVDFDFVEDSNLQRQVIHGMNWIGQPKIDSARARILELNPYCQVNTFRTRLSSKNAIDIINKFDVVCDCTDNFPSRYLINDACLILNKPNIYGSVSRFEGQATVFNLNKDSPNYRDLLPEPPPPGVLPSCAEGGVIGVLPGLIGLIQATETIKVLTGIGNTLDGRLLVFDALKMTFRELTLKPSSNKEKIKKLINYEKFCGEVEESDHNIASLSIESISVHELKKLLENDQEGIILLDVRNKSEYDIFSIKESKLIPLKDIENGEAIESIRKMTKEKKLYVHCKSGKRSLKALGILKRNDIQGINVAGGIDAWVSNKLSNG
tara:strand:- start:168 stop:1331 length:1164 start_codon:yes stop_codon:yes gene_type:complete